jgi:YggT family protein
VSDPKVGHLSEGLVGAVLTYWYYYLPDYALAVLMYTVLGRAALSLFLDADSQNYIWRFFCSITDPVIAAVGVVTPKASAPVILWLFSFVWLFWLRFLLRVVYGASGLLPVA